jgi:hypothetical protein
MNKLVLSQSLITFFLHILLDIPEFKISTVTEDFLRLCSQIDQLTKKDGGHRVRLAGQANTAIGFGKNDLCQIFC